MKRKEVIKSLEKFIAQNRNIIEELKGENHYELKGEIFAYEHAIYLLKEGRE
tara:strand:- start:763 stop:918 length:156 start_codon:yes stop_codon:yes gene_type:complete